jgi:hypothetical protein
VSSGNNNRSNRSAELEAVKLVLNPTAVVLTATATATATATVVVVVGATVYIAAVAQAILILIVAMPTTVAITAPPVVVAAIIIIISLLLTVMIPQVVDYISGNKKKRTRTVFSPPLGVVISMKKAGLFSMIPLVSLLQQQQQAEQRH